jgi:hypothetical protein
MLVQDWGATVRFQNGSVAAQAQTWSLWRIDGTPRLGLVEDGRYFDGWLARRGTLSIWPDGTGRVRGTLRFALTLPPGSRPVTVRFGVNRYRVEPGKLTGLVYRIDHRGPFTLPFSAKTGTWLQDLRSVSVKSTPPVFERAAAPKPAQLA